MRKRLNINLNLSFSSFHICRTKRADAVPPAAAYRGLSPFNPKACDINFPRLLPAPPPTTPDEGGLAMRLKIPEVAPAFDYSRSWSDCSSESLEFAGRNNAATTNYMTKMAPLAATTTTGNEFGDGEPHRPEKLKVIRNKLGINKSGGAAVVPWEEAEEYEETGSLPFSSSSLSLEELITESEGDQKKRKDLKAAGGISSAMAVVKKSSNPKEDFKRSMMEMISEKEIYECEELEELLQCLLSLNSRHYHGHIVAAFSEIWEDIFCGFNI